MKIKKILSAAALSVVMAATMAVSASAATANDAVDAAKKAGVQSHNVQQLSNFLEAYSDHFTAAQYDTMVATLQETGDKYVAPIADKLFQKAPADLTEDERVAVGRDPEFDEKGVIDSLVALGDKVGVKVTVTKSTDNIGYDVSAVIPGGDDSKPIVNPADNPVAPTGDAADINAAAAVIAGIAILFAGAGIVVVARKNKEN